jgi:hypothetical protein
VTQPARLTARLLARKGRALPARGFAGPAQSGTEPLSGITPLTRLRPLEVAANLPELVDYRAGVTDVARGGGRPPGRGPKQRVAMTLRLDRARHRQLRIFAARLDRTSQDVILAALDAYLDAHGGGCACLTECTGDHDQG